MARKLEEEKKMAKKESKRGRVSTANQGNSDLQQNGDDQNGQ